MIFRSVEMSIREWIKLQPMSVQTEVWKRLTAFLTTIEISQVMTQVEKGNSLYKAHEKLGLVDKYQLELSKIVGILGKNN
jgi:hypothetical protein